jgi:hypothetical protein
MWDSAPGRLLLAAEHAVDIGAGILRQGRSHIGALIGKGDRDFATDVDLQIETAIRASLAEAAPGIPFLGEEAGGEEGSGRVQWVETGAPIIPAAITGTSHLWRGALPKLRSVQLTFLPAVAPVAPPAGRDTVAELIDHRVWPAVQDEYGRLRATPGLFAAGLAAIGISGGLLAKRQLDARRKPSLLGRVEPRRMRQQNARHRLLGRLRSLR